MKVRLVNIAEHPRFVSGFNPNSESWSSSSRKMYAGKQKGPICSRPRPIGESSEPFGGVCFGVFLVHLYLRQRYRT